MKRTSAILLVLSAWQPGCSDAPVSVASATSALLDAKPSQASNVVAVKTASNGEEQLCTGSLLLPNLVLTARHCLSLDRAAIESGDCAKGVLSAPDENTFITVVANADVDTATEARIVPVREAWLPEDEARLCGQDLALLYLTDTLDETPWSLTVTVPPAEKRFRAYGYGLASDDYGLQRMTEKATVTCVGADCEDERLVDNELLAHSGVCEGDSGGPAIDGKGQIFALASRTAEDCSETAYVAFSEHLDWLAAATRKVAAEGKLDVPEWARLPSTDEEEPTDPPPTPGSVLHASGGCSHAPAAPHSPGALFVGALAALALRRRRFPSSPSSRRGQAEHRPNAQSDERKR